ncbi:unnamed protein product [Candidula unifasciata]|uniref:SCA7 domain-containing protein n=1 Tax=Candidula unifasciata TaxID=100452 RepID=A0A8S3Z0G2_9EUPU|nr:unnamed protein product [Candidula unifasciata]
MATQERSPSLIIFQQWSALTDLGSSDTEKEKEHAADKDGNRNSSGDSMKLGKQDMSLFGFCPSRDEFSLVVCEKCNLLVKPQALKQHIESRHGLTNLSSLGSISASALNSELGKKLLMPLPIKSDPLPAAVSNDKRAREAFKPLSAGRLPSKASLKQASASTKNCSIPILSGGVKINITKPVKSGSRLTPVKAAACAISNPIVKVEKLDEISITSSIKTAAKQEGPEPPLSELSKNILNIDSTKISTLLNGSVKSAVVALTTPPSTLATSSPPTLSPIVSTAVTKVSTDTILSTRNVITFVSTSLTRPQVMSPHITVAANGPLAVNHLKSAKSIKLSKDRKDRKFLPCKDREYDANKHCGVAISETGKPCTRSLTCKTHALSLRRAVSGRSKPFDGLLKEHKAVKDAILKAKAEAQRASAGTSSVTSTVTNPDCSVTTSLAADVAKQQTTPVMSFQSRGKPPHLGCSPVATRTTMSSDSISTTATSVVKPHHASNVFQRFTSTVTHPTITVKEETTVNREDPSSRLSMSSEVSSVVVQDLKQDHNFMSRHPRPMACNHFGGRFTDRSCMLFSRKVDYVRAALLSALQRQLNPPPPKKLCMESNLPEESQAFTNSQDPYEFNLADTSGSGGGSVSPAVVSPLKPAPKPKSKLPASPVAASSFNNQTISFYPGTVSSSLPLLALPVSTLCSAPIEAPSVSSSSHSPSWPVRTWSEASTHTSSASASTALSSTQVTNPGSRKRSGSSTGGYNGPLMTFASNNGTLPVNSPASLTMTLTSNTSGGTRQQTGLIGVITPTNLNSLQSGNLIAFPNVSLSNSCGQQQSTSAACAAKLSSSVGGVSSVTSHKNIFKDFNLVLTGLDSSLVNGQQYVNISSAQLAELTKIPGQTLFLNNFTPGNSNGSSASGNIHSINRAGSLPTARPAKRSRSSGSKPQPALISSDRKIAASALETYKLVPTSSLQSNAVLLDGGRLQDAMFTLAPGSTTPTLVAIASHTDNTNSAMVMGNSSQVLCRVGASDTSSVINSSALANGISQTTRGNSGSISHHHHTSSSRPHHHHHHHNHLHRQEHSKTQQQQDMFVTSVLQVAPSVANPIQSPVATQLGPNQTLFKPHGTFNLTAKNMAGKLAMQPMSLTFPISVSQAGAGLGALTSGLPQQLQAQHQLQPHHKLSVTTNGVGTELEPSTAALVTAKTDLHLQSQMSGTSTGSLIS